MSDTGKLEDDFAFDTEEVHPEPGKTFTVKDGRRVEVEDGSLSPVLDAPSKNAEREAWVDYCVSLGADRHYIDNETKHIVDATPGAEKVETHEPLTQAELRSLAKSLGG